jgi:hypothetical protein
MSFARRSLLLAGCTAAFIFTAARAQYRQEPGHSLGTVTKTGNLIVLTMEPDALGKANLFDLQHHTLRFTPDGAGYRVEAMKEQWDADFGPEMQGSEATLKSFAFPFSGKTWSEFSVGMTGSITFGPRFGAAVRPPSVVDARDTGGLAVDRFAELAQSGPQFVN